MLKHVCYNSIMQLIIPLLLSQREAENLLSNQDFNLIPIEGLNGTFGSNKRL